MVTGWQVWYDRGPFPRTADASKESETKSVTLKEGRLIDIARMLQFVYTGDWYYSADKTGPDNSITLRSRLLSAGRLIESYTTALEPKSVHATNIAMLSIAEYLDIPSLRVFVARR